MTREEHIEKIYEIVKANRELKTMLGEQNTILSAIRDYTSADVEEAYKEGLHDAWNAARKIILGESDYGVPIKDIFKMFNTHYTWRVIRDFSAQEAIERITEYERQKWQIKKGDEVALRDEDRKAVIMDEAEEENTWHVYTENGCVEKWHENVFRKIGRTFPQIEEVLKAMQEGADNG